MLRINAIMYVLYRVIIAFILFNNIFNGNKPIVPSTQVLKWNGFYLFTTPFHKITFFDKKLETLVW